MKLEKKEKKQYLKQGIGKIHPELIKLIGRITF